MPEQIAVDELVKRSADLKRELVKFARGPRFEKQLSARMRLVERGASHSENVGLIATIDQFALQHRFSDGGTVIGQFIEQHRPPLPAADREMLLGWHDVVDGLFEFRGLDGNAALLHNLIDDLVYRAHSNLGRESFKALSEGMFVAVRLVPIHPATDDRLISGLLLSYPQSDAREIASTASELATTSPHLVRRNPDLVRRGWERQAEARADFIEACGSDLVVLPPLEAQEQLRKFFRFQQRRAIAKAATRSSASSCTSPASRGSETAKACFARRRKATTSANPNPKLPSSATAWRNSSTPANKEYYGKAQHGRPSGDQPDRRAVLSRIPPAGNRPPRPPAAFTRPRRLRMDRGLPTLGLLSTRRALHATPVTACVDHEAAWPMWKMGP
jgi:hypothetical protein